jgi:hypothetical protein
MQRSYQDSNVSPVTEMAIVDTFTKLIFGDEAYSEQESLIIDAFRSVRPDVQRDSCQEMGEYLRNLGVREMIQLVSRLRQHISEQVETPVAIRNQATPDTNASALGRDRGFH